jgi:hypothetical protein
MNVEFAGSEDNRLFRKLGLCWGSSKEILNSSILIANQRFACHRAKVVSSSCLARGKCSGAARSCCSARMLSNFLFSLFYAAMVRAFAHLDQNVVPFCKDVLWIAKSLSLRTRRTLVFIGNRHRAP